VSDSPIPNDKRKCHLTGFKKSCRSLVVTGDCERWANIQGQHPQTGEVVNQYACVDDQVPFLLLKIGLHNNQLSAAMESMRNESAKQHAESKTMAAIAVSRSRDAVKEAIFERLPSHVQDAVKLIGN
jgi:hypothetical protein